MQTATHLANMTAAIQQHHPRPAAGDVPEIKRSLREADDRPSAALYRDDWAGMVLLGHRAFALKEAEAEAYAAI